MSKKLFILKSGFNTPQLAVTDFKRQKIPVAESKKICGKYPTTCYRDSRFLGIFFILLFFIFLFPVASATLKIEKEAINVAIVPEIKQDAVFNFELTNLGEDDNFSIYSLVGVDFKPESVFIKAGETKNVLFTLTPNKKILTTPGTFNFLYKIEGKKSGMQQDELAIRIVNLKDAIEINSYNIHLDSDKATIYVKNLVDSAFEIKAKFHSAFFDFDKKFFLDKYEKKEFETELNKEEIKKLVAGEYSIITEIETYNVKEKIESKFKFTEKPNIVSKEIKQGTLIFKTIVEKINEGNVPYIVQVRINKNALSRLFTTFNIEPISVEREGFRLYYVFQKEIKPSEIFAVKATTNWFYPLILLVALIIIGFLISALTFTHLVLRKKIGFVKTKNGEFALKVSIIARAKGYIEKINITDKIPALAKLYSRFGAIEPTKIDEKNRRLEWHIESLQADEERVFSYVIYSKVAPVGKFELPRAIVVYEKEGKVYEAESNKVFFLSETRKTEE